ncbi:acetyltransferase [Paenibacillus hunanensis]|uniref:Acetyltransferase n=1 Tax=Paenibacillus hunanensis TaxID=539262 RepID=A0ABU1J2A1_9BACL|nr:acetyltransferase [Paenibacillus hunanensis]MDR6245586.1 putative acetyltransferase [Paenibacillus hunanensis]GGJ09248.1 acetyltransferase [Paenibacillus hunanensis]
MHIRNSNTTDTERAIDIWRDAVDATHHFLTPEHRSEIEHEVQSFLPNAPIWLAVDESDQALGFMLLDGDHIEALFIDPAHHGKGIGKALIAYAVHLQGDITTDVNEQNTQAVGFYQRLGFKVTGTSPQDSQGRPYPLIHLHRAKDVPL